MCGERARCAINWKEGASKKRMTNDRKKAKERQEGTRFTAQIVRRCGFGAWGLCGGSFSMCARVETWGYARAVWRWVLIRARFAIARRMNSGAADTAFGWPGWKIGGRYAGKGGRVLLRRLSGGVVSRRGVCAAVHFRCAQEWKRGLCARIGTGCRIWARVAIGRRENDTGRLKLLFCGAAARPGCGWFGHAWRCAIRLFRAARIVGTRKATFRRVCVARSALI